MLEMNTLRKVNGKSDTPLYKSLAVRWAGIVNVKAPGTGLRSVFTPYKPCI